MRLAFVCKYPPIQGGEATKAYFLSQALADRGHSVTVISNGREISDLDTVAMPNDEARHLVSENLAYYSTAPGPEPFFISQYALVQERLASLVLELHAQYKFDLILGWYLFPYCLAASISAKLLRIPYVTQHAGSDLKRQMGDQRLYALGQHVFREAAGVLSYPSAEAYFRALGCTRVHKVTPAYPDAFRPDGPHWPTREEAGLVRDAQHSILFLGKIGRGKGLDLLLDSMQHLEEKWSVILLTTRRGRAWAAGLVAERGLQGRVVFMDAVAPWLVPSVIRSCGVVVVPEHDFGVAKHRSGLPVEAVLCGTPAVVSSEISRHYQALEWRILTCDPTDSAQLAARIRVAVESNLGERIRAHHSDLRGGLPSHESFASEVERILTQCRDEAKSESTCVR